MTVRVTRSSLLEVFRRRDLLYMFTWRDIKLKYKQSVMGLLWAILMPVVIVSAGLMVRYAFAALKGAALQHDDLVLVSVKAVPWAFAVSSIRFASNSLISNANLITKIRMPREIFPLSSILSQLMDFLVAATILLLVIVAIVGVHVRLTLLWMPVFMGLLILLCTGFGIFLSAAALFFRDVKYIVEIILTFAIFFTPVFYEVSLFGRWSTLLLLNPVAPLFEGLGSAATGRPMPAPIWFAYSAVVAVGGCVLALAFFRKVEPYFAESA